MDASLKQRLVALHRVNWSGAAIWLLFVIAFLLLNGWILLLLLQDPLGPWQIAGLVVGTLLLSHVMHVHLIALHEAAHGLLSPVRWVNDVMGVAVGVFGLLSLSLYRAAHHAHHAYLATERDEELWPFVHPASPRWARRLAAFIELTCGLLFTPFLFLRAFLRRGTVIRNPAIRRRIWIETIGIFAFWGLVVGAVACWDLWKFWLFMYVVPAWIAGNTQSLRKYIEHMGVTGSTALSATRSVQPSGWTGRFISLMLFHEPFHGIHHKYPRLPHQTLPEVPSMLLPSEADEFPPFPSYRAALWDMLPSLSDPRVGRQWQEASQS